MTEEEYDQLSIHRRLMYNRLNILRAMIRDNDLKELPEVVNQLQVILNKFDEISKRIRDDSEKLEQERASLV